MSRTVSVTGVSAQVPWTPTPVSLAPVGGGSYAATVTAPLGRIVPVLFQTTGTYLQTAPFTRWNYDSINVLSPTRLFTGGFSDAPLTGTGTGLRRHPVHGAGGLRRRRYFLVSADLFDWGGNFLDHASATQAVPGGSQAVPFVLTFDLSSANCVQFGAPFAVQNLSVVDGATLLSLDRWTGAIPTASYAGTSFQCRQGVPQPISTSVQPSQGAVGQQFLTLWWGHGFRPGATLTLGPDLTVSGVQRVDDTLLTATLLDPRRRHPRAPRPDGHEHRRHHRHAGWGLHGAQDQPPSVSIESITGLLAGNVLPPSPGPVTITATAADEGRVTSVDFLLDDVVRATVTAFPFIWKLDPGTVSHGGHAIKARAHDDAGLTTDSATVTVYASPPR